MKRKQEIYIVRMSLNRVKITIFSTDIWARKVDMPVLFFVSKMGEQMHKLNFYVKCQCRIYFFNMHE